LEQKEGQNGSGFKRKSSINYRGQPGFGKSCALGFADEGCRVAICGRGEEALNETAEELRGKDVAVLAVPADVTKLEDNKNVVSQAAEMFGRIDILVNNAGAGKLSDPMELPEEEFRYAGPSGKARRDGRPTGSGVGDVRSGGR
jgi:3-oxoacyl-[acyl-carrier protein] reductase